MDIREATEQCRSTGLTGWDMVEYVNKLVNQRMSYALDIPLALHTTAFRRGRGYCVQQAFCVRDILRGLGYDVQLVYSSRTAFPAKNKVCGHTWCRVSIDGVQKDVCTCNADNRPGSVDFSPVSKVGRYRGLVVAAGYLGSIPVCIKRLLAGEGK